jgi:DNA-binding transcriptional MerR regulator
VHTVGMKSVPDTELSVTDLAARSGVPVSSIRMYQQRKLLAPPERRGRTAIYGQAHLDRLLLIERLQGRGYSLAAILDVIAQEAGGLAQLLDLEVPTMAAEQSITMSLVELVQLLPSGDFSLETLQRTTALGLLEIKGSDVTVRQPAFLAAGQALGALDIPTSAILDAYELMRANVMGIANEFARVFDTYTETGRQLQDNAQLSAEELDNATTQLDQLTKTALDVVASELRHALRTIAEERLASISVGETAAGS